MFSHSDPKVIVMLPDPMLDPELYPDNKVLWVEYERDLKVWPLSSKLWKQVYGRQGQRKLNSTTEAWAKQPDKPWHRSIAVTDKAKTVQ